MTQEKAKLLIKISKYIVISLLAIFFVIIIIQSVKINNLSFKKNVLYSEYQTKQAQKSLIEDEIEYINNNKDEYSEEELRKDNYKKDNETFVKS